MLGLVLGVEVIKVAEELVEAVHRRQKVVAVAEMVLAELPGRIALRLQQFGDRRVLLRQAFLRGRQPDLQQPGAQRRLSGDEGGAARGAGLLAVVVGEDSALVGDAIDVGRAIAHHAAVVGADVPVADVVAHDDDDVRLLRGLRAGRPSRRSRERGHGYQQSAPDETAHAHSCVLHVIAVDPEGACSSQNFVMFAAGEFGCFASVALYASTVFSTGPMTQLYISPMLCSSRGSDSMLNTLG